MPQKKQRIAMRGKSNFINERFADVTVTVLYKQGCAVYSEKDSLCLYAITVFMCVCSPKIKDTGNWSYMIIGQI
jgi:hypothetical protein